tara:strand:- start:1330 stop:1443 length:114 start_codon:yes stop_codon:yes gene_type:complete
MNGQFPEQKGELLSDRERVLSQERFEKLNGSLRGNVA